MKNIPSTFQFLLLLLLFGCSSDPSTDNSGDMPPSGQWTNPPLFLSNDYGQTWQDVSQGLPAGLQVSALEPKGDEIVLASDNGGIYLSSNSRTAWQQIGGGLPGKKITALHVSGNTIYAGVHQKGIFKTDDDGNTWQSITYDLPDRSVQAICQTPNGLFAGTDTGIFLLSAETWKPTSVKNQVVSIVSYKGILIAGTGEGTVRSNDNGNTWPWISTQRTVHATRQVGDKTFEFGLNGDVYESDDLGQSWNQVRYEPREGSHVYDITKAGIALLMSNNYGVHRSMDNGRTWQLIYPSDKVVFDDFVVFDKIVYGGARALDE